ncbi:MAG: ChaN family lipoprotein [Cytophagales bacterium]|nr:ChaN family lipoprotein [Cytophagales bacterium]
MNKYFLVAIVLAMNVLNESAIAQNDGRAYQLFNEKGQKINFKKFIKKLAEADIVFFGELHNNPIAHWMALRAVKGLHEQRKGQLMLGAEMFESDEQLLLNEYLNGFISTKSFESQARLWNNYRTDYKPLVEFAKFRRLPFVATNVPRRYASIVHKKGFKALDSLPGSSKKFIAPLPVKVDLELSSYREMLKMMGSHGGENIVKAQALKDATMAHFILKNIRKDTLFFHCNGSYHSNDFQGIVWCVRQEKPELKIVTVNTVEQDDPGALEKDLAKRASFTLCVPKDMTKTF